jgi:hypothetical protein
VSAEHRRVALFSIFLLAMVNMFSPGRISAATESANASVSPMTLNQVVDKLMARNIERSKELKSFESTRVYTVRYHGFPKDMEAKMVVAMRYEAPNTKEFTVISQSGPKLLVDKVLKRLLKTETEAQQEKTREAVNLDRANYEFSDLRYVPSQDGCSYTLSVQPRETNKYLYRGTIRVNDHDFAVCGIQAQPAENPSFWITSTSIHETYGNIGGLWLPEQNKSVSNIRFGGTATLTIQYQNYKVHSQHLADADTSPSSSSAGK